MIALGVILATLVYLILAIAFIVIVRRKTKKKLYRWLAVAIAVLLPTWDMVLGNIVYYPLCLFWSKAEIYDTAETDSVYYEGYPCNTISKYKDHRIKLLSGKVSILRAGDKLESYKYIESKVTRERIQDYTRPSNFYYRNIKPVFYGCDIVSFIDNGRQNLPIIKCFEINSPRSRYKVSNYLIKIGAAVILSKKIYDIKNNKVMAVCNEVELKSYLGIPGFPFFNWLHWWPHRATANRCQYDKSNISYSFFELQVLKPENKGD